MIVRCIAVISLPRAAKALNRCARTVRRLVAKKKLQMFRTATGPAVPVAEVEVLKWRFRRSRRVVL